MNNRKDTKRIFNFFTKEERSEKLASEFCLLDEKISITNDDMNYKKAREAAELLKSSGVTLDINESERKKLLDYILEE